MERREGERAWQFHGAVLEGSFLISHLFPGLPDAPDGAVECPQGDCAEDSVLFAKGDTMYTLDLSTNTVKARQWPAVRNCSALMRFIDRYYCFQGTLFVRFHPATGDVKPGYPKDARDYFMVCPGRGHASENATIDRRLFDRCSDIPYDAFDHDALGRMYAFRDDWYFRVDAQQQRVWHPWRLNSSWPELRGPVNAVFTWDNKMYFIQGQQVFIYKAVARYSLIHGYPRPLRDELGISGPVDAAFICPTSSLVYLITGSRMREVNLKQAPRTPSVETDIPHQRVHGAMCDRDGVWLMTGRRFHLYPIPAVITVPGSVPDTGSFSDQFLGCAD
ncbi:LOW QUALITY PROTEIN: hemopexin-like [Rhinoraja longicauda]